MSEGTVTRWISELANGDPNAQTEIWHRYFQRLVSLARGQLSPAARRTSDEEDVALSAMDSFFRAAKAGRFPALHDRDDLWKLLLVIAARKVVARHRRYFAASRPDQYVSLEPASPDQPSLLKDAIGPEPTPDFAAECSDTLRERLEQLPDDACRQIAVWRLEGYTNREIAQKLGTYEVKIERKLRLIRKCWTSLSDKGA